MKNNDEINYHRIAKAIAFIEENKLQQPSLEQVAAHIHLSPSHFGRLFKEWAGTTPKKFLEFLTLHHAKRLLKDRQLTLFDTALQTGLSGTGRLHDLFINIEGMSPAKYKKEAENLVIRYAFHSTIFGEALVANTEIGVCYLAFEEQRENAVEEMRSRFSKANFHQAVTSLQRQAVAVLSPDFNRDIDKLKLHLRGTKFQLKVWEALLRIPMGDLSTYGRLAQEVGSPKAARAVGTAVGSNPVAFLIPCHRVIRTSGTFGDYRWGRLRKEAMIAWESARVGY